MGRTILAISGSAAALLPRPFAAVATFWHEMTRHALRSYKPERHYMRGPGPACRAKNGVQPTA